MATKNRKVSNTCDYCGAFLPPGRRKYCSEECARLGYRATHKRAFNEYHKYSIRKTPTCEDCLYYGTCRGKKAKCELRDECERLYGNGKFCTECGKGLTGRQKKYCSTACKQEHYRKNEKLGNCIVCGKELSGRQRKYCSKKCKNKDYRDKHPRVKENKNCIICGKTLIGKQRKYCCDSCRTKDYYRANAEKYRARQRAYYRKKKEHEQRV